MKQLQILYTLICTLSPILRVYSLTGNNLTVLDMAILFFYIVSIQTLFSKGTKVVLPYFIMFASVLIQSSFILWKNGDLSLFLRALHLLNYVLFLSLYNRKFFEATLALKSIRIAAIAATALLIIQHAGHFVGITIPGQISQFAVREADLYNNVADSDISRFSSFFAEPSAYAVFIICPLALELFYMTKTNLYIVILLCVGCVLSTSNTALACMVFLLIFYFVKNKIFNYKTILLIVAGIVLFVVATPYIEAIRYRIEGGVSIENRFIGYELMKYYLNDPLMGVGFISMGDVGEYMPGFARLVVYLGMIGTIIYISIYANIFLTTQRKMVLLVFLFLNLGSNIFFAASIIFYSCFFLDHSYSSKNINLEKSKRRRNGKNIYCKYCIQ